MTRPLIVVAAVLCSSIPASAQERVIGLLSLPQVFGPRQCAPFEPEEIALHALPNDGKPFAFIRVDQNWSFAPHGGCEGLEVSVHRGPATEELPTREFDYEMPAALAVERRDGWIRIRLKDGAAWVQQAVTDKFMPLAELYEEFVGVTEINQAFTGRMTGAPGVSNGPIMPRVEPGKPVRVIEIRESWIRIELLSNSACTAPNDGPPEVIATGWLPLHDAKGDPSVWFASRGC
jgi:hypothetical protein